MNNYHPNLLMFSGDIQIEAICKKCLKLFFVPRDRDAKGKPKYYRIPQLCPKCKRIKNNQLVIWNKREQRSGLRPKCICKLCGKEFLGHKRLFCSARCRNRWHNGLGANDCCKVCMAPVQGARKYCSDKCANKAMKDKARAKAREAARKWGATVENSYTMAKHHVTGTVSEMLFDVWATAKGVPVARLVAACSPIVDRVIWLEGEWKGVQVKSAYSKGFGWRLRDTDVLDPGICPLFAIVNPSNGDVIIYNTTDILLRKQADETKSTVTLPCSLISG